MHQDKTAFITGGSRGLGNAFATQLLNNGIKVIAPTRSELDLASPESVSEYIEKNKNRRIDILINNAGINPIFNIDDLPEFELQRVVQVNMLSPIMITKMVFPGMKERGFGRIVNISSIWSMIGKAGRSSYAATKAGMAGFTRHIAIEGAAYGVLVNTVAPGFVNTEMTKQNNTLEAIRDIEKDIPIARMANPEEIANFISFLVSEKNSYITGQELCIDGGYTIQ